MHSPLIICAAVTGGGPPQARTAFQPVTQDAIVEAAMECWRAGAAIVHLHARTSDGSPTLAVAEYAALVAAIRAQGCEALLSLSAGDNGGQADHDQRLAVADVDAEIISLGAGSFNIGDRLYDNRPDYLYALADKLSERGIVPEVELFDTGHLHSVEGLIDAGKLTGSLLIQLVFGVPGGMAADPDHLPKLVPRLPAGTLWSVSCQGQAHDRYLDLMFDAFIRGGHVRTGVEDHLFVRPDELARTNAAMVAQWADTARTWGRPIATPAQARQMLGLDEGHSHQSVCSDGHAMTHRVDPGGSL